MTDSAFCGLMLKFIKSSSVCSSKYQGIQQTQGSWSIIFKANFSNLFSCYCDWCQIPSFHNFLSTQLFLYNLLLVIKFCAPVSFLPFVSWHNWQLLSVSIILYKVTYPYQKICHWELTFLYLLDHIWFNSRYLNSVCLTCFYNKISFPKLRMDFHDEILTI